MGDLACGSRMGVAVKEMLPGGNDEEFKSALLLQLHSYRGIWGTGPTKIKKNSEVQMKELNGKKINKGAVLSLKSGKKMQKWYAEALAKSKTPEERRTLRSKTFPNMAKEIAAGKGDHHYRSK